MSTPTSLAEVRARIDAIDSTVIELLAARQELVRTAATFKRDEHAVRAPDRFAQLIASVRERAEAAGLTPDIAETIWRAMVGAFIEMELAEHEKFRSQPS
ncbi:chorismate mutase [Nocardia sp. MH4]|uniref:chorismate mutase n=1 Tax=Nocardia TaxID=1817 RepID=UPI001C50260B|nr:MULTISPECIES: chorismate mutase [Nocardia]MBW0274388.1 chorismate mutase [Nocardia sp. MH4]